MGKFDGYLICTDLDGTFTCDYELCGENAKYVKYFQENGGLFTVATGRLPSHFSNLPNFAPNCPVVTHNGASVYDFERNEFLYKNAITEDVSEIVDFIFEHECVLRIWINTDFEGYDINSKDDIHKSEELYKIVVCAEPASEALKLKNTLFEKFGGKFCIFLAWDTGIEILAKDTNKGTAVKKLRELLGDRVKKMICVGDSESDAFMFESADVGYAVENADEYAKSSANRITVNFKEGFVKYIIEEIEREL